MQDLSSPQTPGCLQHQMSSCQRQSKSDKHAGWTSEENLAACSSAISAWESSYKKHLLHFVLSMMLWKINTVMVCLPLLSLSRCESARVSVCMHANAHVLACFSVFMCLCVGMRGWICVIQISGANCIIICTVYRGGFHLQRPGVLVKEPMSDSQLQYWQ